MIYYASIMQMYFMTIECLCLLSFKVYIKLRKTLNYDHFNLVQIWHKKKINIYTKPHDKKKDGFSWYIKINKYKFDRQNCSKTQKKKI